MDKSWLVRGEHSSTKVGAAKQYRHEMTAAERTLWNRLRRNQLGGLHFRRQQVIDGFIADFYCHAAGLVVEVDGEIHKLRIDEDRERDAAIALRGLRVLRFTNDRILRDLSNCLAEIRAAVKRFEAPGCVPPSSREGGQGVR